MHAGTLVTALAEKAHEGGAPTTFYWAGATETWSPGELLETARHAATVLLEAGVQPGDRVGILGPNRPQWLIWTYATWMVDATVVPLPFHLLAGNDVVGQHVGSILRSAPCRVVVTNAEMAPAVPRKQSWVDWDTTAEAPIASYPTRTSVPAVVQFTSGSTSAPKGVVLSHATLLRAIWGTWVGSRATQDDVTVSWMPLFHDWGFVSFGIGPYSCGVRNHIMDVERFATDPARWLRLATEVGATALAAPPSAWTIALRVALANPAGIDLAHVWHFDMAAEMIAPEVVETLRREGPALGIDPDAIRASYGMAEMGLGATRTDPTRPLQFREVDAAALERGVVEDPADGPSKRVVACGSPLPHIEVGIRVEGQPVGDHRVGEVTLRMQDMFTGYLQDGQITDPRLPDGFFPTGDLGFMEDGVLYITGRAKELVIVGGRNVPAQDIEWAAERVSGVRKGRTLAFSIPDREGHAVVVVEPGRLAKPEDLAAAVRRQVSASLGLTPEVLVVPRDTVTKTTSGKSRRVPVMEDYLRGELAPLSHLA